MTWLCKLVILVRVITNFKRGYSHQNRNCGNNEINCHTYAVYNSDTVIRYSYVPNDTVIRYKVKDLS